MSITFVVLNQTKKRIAFLKILSILLVACLGCVTLHAQSALEISLEKKINERYSTPRKLIKEYEELLSKKAYSSPVDQNIIKVYLAFCREAMEESKKIQELSSAINYPFNKKLHPLASYRGLLLQAHSRKIDKEYDEAKKLVNACLENTKAPKYKTLRADAYYFAALLEFKINNSDRAKELWTKCLSFSKKNNLHAQEAQCLRKLGYLDQFIDANLNLSKQNITKSLIISKNNNLDVLSAETFRSLSGIYFNQGQSDSGITFLKKAIQLFDKLNLPRGLISSNISLANNLVDSKNLKEARQCLRDAENICLANDCRDLLPYVYANLKPTIPIDSVDQIVENYEKSIAIAKEFDNNLVVFHSGMNLGVHYGNHSKFIKGQKAYITSKKALVILDSKPFTHRYNRSLVDFHNSWKTEKPQEFNKYAQPINYEKILGEAEEAFKKNNNVTELEYLYRTCANYYKSIDLKKYSTYQELLLKMKDSSNALKLAEANSNYLGDLRTAKKEKDIVKLKADNAIAELEKKQLLFGSILALILLSLIGYYIYKRIQKRNMEEQKERALAIRHKLSNDLHDEVGSNLTGLVLMAEGISMSENPSKTSIDKLATLSRSTMTTMRDTVWAIDSRKDTVGDLVARMIDFGQDLFEDSETLFKIKQEIENDKKLLVTEIRQNIYLLYKEALSNAVKHSKGNELNLFIKQTDKSFELKVHNNGDADEKIKASGLGLESMRERAEAFGGTFTIDTQDGFTVRAIFPL